MQKKRPQTAEIAVRPCRKCGRQILLAFDEGTGKTVPLDLTTRTYGIVEDQKIKGKFYARHSMAYTSHYDTCAALGRDSDAGDPPSDERLG